VDARKYYRQAMARTMPLCEINPQFCGREFGCFSILLLCKNQFGLVQIAQEK